jgi:DNA-binding NarL/FixJ family response regulator
MRRPCRSKALRRAARLLHDSVDHVCPQAVEHEFTLVAKANIPGALGQLLSLMAEGRSNAGIAHALWVTEGTVEKHVHSILGKLPLPDTHDDHRRVLAVLAFLEAR